MSQAEPVETAMPVPGYVMPELVSQVIVPFVFVKTFVPEVEVITDKVSKAFAPKTDPAAIELKPVPPLPTSKAVVVRVKEPKLPAPVVVKLFAPKSTAAVAPVYGTDAVTVQFVSVGEQLGLVVSPGA